MNFPNKAYRLWPVELLNARLLLDTRHDGLTVPASVVQQGQNGSYAYGLMIEVIERDGDSPLADKRIVVREKRLSEIRTA